MLQQTILGVSRASHLLPAAYLRRKFLVIVEPHSVHKYLLRLFDSASLISMTSNRQPPILAIE